MPISDAELKGAVGRDVIHRPMHQSEYGQITIVQNDWVFVTMYGQDKPKACLPCHLTLLEKKPDTNGKEK